MTTNRKFNPMTDVADRELLAYASKLFCRGHSPTYWKDFPVPVQPQGVVKFESIRMAATFVVPMAILGIEYLLNGAARMPIAAVAALSAGIVLHAQLSLSMKRQRAYEDNWDRGRFEAIAYLSDRLGVDPADLTLAVIEKMHNDHIRLSRADAVVASAAAQKVAERDSLIKRNFKLMKEGKLSFNPYAPQEKTTRRASGGAAAANAMGLAGGAIAANPMDTFNQFPEVYSYDDFANDISSPYGSVNPTSGLPMLDNSPFDVGGNVFGSDDTSNPHGGF